MKTQPMGALHRRSVIPDFLEPGPIEVVIPHRTPELTIAALQRAEKLGLGLDLSVRLIDVHVVPYALPIDKPSVSLMHLEETLRAIAGSSGIPIHPELVLARDWEEGLRRSLRPRSLILVPIRKAWWRSFEKRMAQRLRKQGHQAICVECV